MLASQLLLIAKDMLNDYERLGVIEALNDAYLLASERPHMNNATFNARRQLLVTRADRMLSETITRNYPIDIKKILNLSEYYQCLPESIAKTIIAGFRGDRKEAAISSAEIQMYREEANRFYQSMENLVNSSESFGVEVYQTPEKKVALELRLPDSIYGRELAKLPEKLVRADSFIGVVEELATNSRGPHHILWASTTDLVISVLLDWVTVQAVLFAYERLLVAAEKHLTVGKLLRDLKQYGGDAVGDIEEKLQISVQVEIERAIKEVMEKANKNVNNARRNELQIELGAQQSG